MHQVRKEAQQGLDVPCPDSLAAVRRQPIPDVRDLRYMFVRLVPALDDHEAAEQGLPPRVPGATARVVRIASPFETGKRGRMPDLGQQRFAEERIDLLILHSHMEEPGLSGQPDQARLLSLAHPRDLGIQGVEGFHVAEDVGGSTASRSIAMASVAIARGSHLDHRPPPSPYLVQADRPQDAAVQGARHVARDDDIALG